jgi:hypothetical protein
MIMTSQVDEVAPKRIPGFNAIVTLLNKDPNKEYTDMAISVTFEANGAWAPLHAARSSGVDLAVIGHGGRRIDRT